MAFLFFLASCCNKVDLKRCDLVFSSLLWHTSKWNGFVHLPWDHCRLLIAAISWLTGCWRTEVLVPPSLQCTRHWCRCEMEGKLMFLLKDYKKQQEFFIWLHGDYSITRHCKLVRRKKTFNLPEQDTTNTLFLIKHRKRWIGVFTTFPSTALAWIL